MENNHSQVLILTHSPDPERICSSAAKISTTLGTANDIYQSAINSNLITKVLKSGHFSLIEHVNFTIAFENVSAFIEQFMIEFRLASFTIKSRRYVDFKDMGYYIPEFRCYNSNNISNKNEITNIYTKQMDYLFSEYEFFINQGIPKEDARFILPYCFKSNFYCTVNARELLHIIYSAIYGRGEKFSEIREFGNSLLEQAKEIIPSIFNEILLIENGREDKEARLKELVFNYKVDIDNTNSNCIKNICDLIGYTNEPDKLVAATTLINHASCSIDVAFDLISSNKDLFLDLIRLAFEDKRKREFEQVSFTFKINNLSLAGLTHLVRHRMQSINIPSFTEFGISENYVIPDTISKDDILLSKYKTIQEKNYQLYKYLLSKNIYEEDLVYLILSGNVLDVVTTMNARQLLNFIKLRTCYRAQWEIRVIAINMLMEARKIAPEIFRKAGPSCFMSGKCSEGKLCCGKQKEVNELFNTK